MKTQQISRIATTALALLAVITVSGCNSKQENASDTSANTSTTSTTTTTTTASAPTTQTTQAAAPQGTNCAVKGVTSQRLGKIALTTKSPEYNKTKADKCFASTAAAEQAGYKVPK